MTTTPIDYSRKWVVMAAVAVAILQETADSSIVNLALPTLVEALDTTFTAAQWVVLASMLTQTTLILSIGRLGDMIGKKPIFLTGLSIFMVGSIACGLAPDIGWLIGFRVIQATGGAMALGLVFAIITEAFPPNERGKGIGLISTIVSCGIIAGPLIGGVILSSFSWRWIFFINLPVGLIALVAAWRFIPDFRPVGRQSFDFAGAISFFICLLAFLLAMTLGQDRGFDAPLVIGLFAIAGTFLLIFMAIEWCTQEPMVSLRLFHNYRFSVNLLVRWLSFVTYTGLIILLPFYLQNILAYSPVRAGLLLAIIPLCLGTIAPLSGTLSDRFGSQTMMISGLVLVCLGYFSVSTLSTDISTSGYILRLIPLGLGMGLFQAPNNSAIMGSVPRTRLGIASGLVSITRTLGSTTGVAILGAIWASRTSYYTDEHVSSGVTTAPINAQMEGLQETFLAAAAFIGLALTLILWSSWQTRRLELSIK